MPSIDGCESARTHRPPASLLCLLPPLRVCRAVCRRLPVTLQSNNHHSNPPHSLPLPHGQTDMSLSGSTRHEHEVSSSRHAAPPQTHAQPTALITHHWTRHALTLSLILLHLLTNYVTACRSHDLRTLHCVTIRAARRRSACATCRPSPQTSTAMLREMTSPSIGADQNAYMHAALQRMRWPVR